jgi:hypothetical protein
MGKILLALQFWDGDRKAADKLARLLADIEPTHSKLADILFVRRFDCEPLDGETIQHVSRKFNVFDYRSQRRGKGWPDGCNDLWFSTIEWVWSMREAQKVPAYKAVFTFEPDGCPLVRDWIPRFISAWDAAQAPVLGCEIPKGTCPRHINGNAMFSCELDFLHWASRIVGSVKANRAWDVELAGAFFQRGAKNFHGLRSLWQTPSVSKGFVDGLAAQGVVFLHGVKDDSVIRVVRERFSLPPG